MSGSAIAPKPNPRSQLSPNNLSIASHAMVEPERLVAALGSSLAASGLDIVQPLALRW